MTEIHDIASDSFAQKSNRITSIDARIKMVFVLLALLINLVSPTIYAPLACAVLCLVTLLLIGVQPQHLLLRLSAPLLLAAVVLVLQVFLYGQTPLFITHLGNWQLTGYQEGLSRGFLIMSRVMGGVSLILFLGMSTPVNRLLAAARWFRLSPTFIELAMLVYRYIFVLLEETITIRNAQKVRLGYYHWHQSLRSTGTLGGSLIVRAYDRAERVFEAMLVRGYSGESRVICSEKLGYNDYAAMAAFLFILAGLTTLGAILR